MRPLVLISGLPVGGAESVTVAFLCRLAAQGQPVPLCTVTARHDGPLASRLVEAGVPRFDLGARRLADAWALRRLVRLLARERVDVVHAHGQDASILATAARHLGGFRLVITRHVLDEPAANWRQRLRSRAALRAIIQSDVPVAVSRATARRLAALVPRAADRIRVLPNGIDLARFDRPDLRAARAEIRRSLGLDPDEPAILVPAVLRPGKGHDVLLDALPLIRARVPRASVLLAGDGELEPDLRARAARLGPAVRFLGRRDDIPALLAASDLVVLPSLAEALPTALMEAAAAGRPVVATDVGGTAEIVQDGGTGLLVPPAEPAPLADAAAALLGNPRRARALGDAGRRRAVASFGMDTQVARTLALWEELVSGGGPS
jgi:glycosyltransferase involved in cell wall biosynthesis